jgi:UDP-N-acetylglucosamine transferase subunit ALG13
VIFVTTGTCDPFDRLLRVVDSLETEERLVVQHGVSPVRPHGAHCVGFLAYDELVAFVREARVVVTHAGVGSVLTALANGKRPIVVPRLAGEGDAIDDHQLEFARKIGGLGLVTLLEHPDDLPRLLASARLVAPPRAIKPDRRLVSELRAYLADIAP